MKNLKKLSLAAHKKYRGKLKVDVAVPLAGRKEMSLFYTPGVAEPCKEIFADAEKAYEYTWKGRLVAVVTDGSAVLGLGNIGGLAGLPVMEGKCALFKKFGGVDAVPICLDTQDTEQVIAAVKAIAPSFGAINLEDIAAPACFEIEERLAGELTIPVFHDDQHGTAVVCLAGMINALKVVGKSAGKVRVVVCGAGAAGIAISKFFLEYGFKDLLLVDSHGLIYEGRGNLNKYKIAMAKVTNRSKIKGGLAEAMCGADVFIGISSRGGIVTRQMVRSMAKNAIVIAISNPDPEILPQDARAAGAKVIATGRSDFPNQINNVLVFPGILRGALEARASKITHKMNLAAAKALAAMVKNPTANKIIPGVFEKGVAEKVADAVVKCR